MEKGVYEQLVTEHVKRVVEKLPELGLSATLENIDAAERAGVLSESFSRSFRAILSDAVRNDENGSEQTRIFESVMERLLSFAPKEIAEEHRIAGPPRQLRLVWPDGLMPPNRPDSPLDAGTLLTGTRLDPSLISQLRKEMESADQLDFLCSFIKWGGIRVLEDDLRRFTARNDTVLRVITTSYLGATDLKAIEFLRELPHSAIRVSYDTHRTSACR
jgi:hypothetical protein